MPDLSRPGATLHYEVWGADTPTAARLPWVTLVNGHTRPLNDYRLMGRYLVERGFRVVALDNRGAGKTEATRDFKFSDFVDDVVALWDELGIRRTHLAGISMGGFIAQTLAIEHPERVDRLVLISTAMDQGGIRRDDSPWSTDLAAVEAKMKPYFTEDFAKRNEVLVKSMYKQIAKNVETGGFAAKSDMQRRAAHGFDASARLGQIAAPTLVIHGDEDGIIAVMSGEELAARIPGARLHVFRDAGHLLLAERPKELYELVANWFAG